MFASALNHKNLTHQLNVFIALSKTSMENKSNLESLYYYSSKLLVSLDKVVKIYVYHHHIYFNANQDLSSAEFGNSDSSCCPNSSTLFSPLTEEGE